MILRDYQQRAVDDAEAFLSTATRGDRRLYSAPTGTGKSVIELALLKEGRYLVTPSLEIITGMLRKLGREAPDTEEALATAAQAVGIWTPIRLRNRLAEASVPQPDALILDEAHRDLSDSWHDVAALAANPPCVGFTATPYRGTPRQTKRFRDEWGPAVEILSLADSVRLGYSSLPSLSVEPLVDDDKITLTSTGEFDVQSANAAISSRIDDACSLVQRLYPFDRPTMLAVPSREAMGLFASRLDSLGIPAALVSGDTSRVDRETGFSRCLGATHLLIQIKVVSEGVDLPIRRLIDLKPTLSPVAWLQQFGRITRPGGNSEYICCCRNLFRFAYLLDGLVPPSFVATEAQAFGDFSSRSALRSVGLEALGRLKATELPFADGCKGTMYAVSTVESGRVIEYTIITHPAYPDPICAKRSRGVGSFEGSRWEPLASIPIIEAGFASIPARRMSERQEAWWKRDAGRYGLDAGAAVNARSFQALPVLANLRRRFK